MVSTAEPGLPRWDLTAIYPGVDSDEYAHSVHHLISLVDQLEALLDAADALDATGGEEVAHLFDRTVVVFNEALGLARQNRLYLQGHIAANTRDQAALARMSELDSVRVRRYQAVSRFVAWVGRIDVEALIATSTLAREHAFPLRTAQAEAAHLMDQPREALVAELQMSGGSAWSRMQEVLSSQITVTINMPGGETIRLPIGETAKFSIDPDRNVRRCAHEGIGEALRQWETPFAAALNGVKGEHITLARERGWDSILDEALFLNHIDRTTLEVMLDACRRFLPHLQRYMKAKAMTLGMDRLASYDLYAPVPGVSREWTWTECAAFVADQFGAYSPELGELARRALDDGWIDAGPRADKDGGAFCLPFSDGVSRVLMNHIGAFEDVAVLAHELGHAYHNHRETDVSHWRRESTPLTLAETASTFCENLVTRAAIGQATDSERLAMLDASLQAVNLFVAEATWRFDFEQAVIERRAERELSAAEFSSLMRQYRLAAFDDALDPEAVGENRWALIPHFYFPDAAFYNFPYAFGLLFGLGLYAIYQEAPETFRRQFDELLSSTGDADAVSLTRRFGIDIEAPAFWESSLDMIRADIDAFVDLVDRRYSPEPKCLNRADGAS